jgi:hypothetical protein
MTVVETNGSSNSNGSSNAANGGNGAHATIGTIRVKQGLAQMLKGGVIVSSTGSLRY